MFDPTVYENLKVVLEGAVYDLDLAGSILVTDRQDWVNLATMSRTYRIAFRLADAADESDPLASAEPSEAPLTAEAVLSTELSDLAGEILELPDAAPGCSLEISFRMELAPGADPARLCPDIEAALKRIWGERFEIRQTLSYEFGSAHMPSENRIQVLFGRRFGEDVAEDLPRLVDHAVLSLQELISGAAG